MNPDPTIIQVNKQQTTPLMIVIPQVLFLIHKAVWINQMQILSEEKEQEKLVFKA